jgi:hypothetical protein
MSLSLMGNLEGLDPAGSLEYPNTLYAFGKSPGTTTLPWFVGLRGDLRTPTAYGSKARPRKMKLIAILDRLRELETGLLDEVSQPMELNASQQQFSHAIICSIPKINTTISTKYLSKTPNTLRSRTTIARFKL